MNHFVTQDGGLLEKAAGNYVIRGLSPLRPSELISQVDALAQAREYQSGRLGGKLAPTLARQPLDIAVARAGAGKCVVCRPADPYPSAAVMTSSAAAGFRQAGSARLKVSLPMVALIADITRHRKGLAGAGSESTMSAIRG
jgi:hypothetical protein